jgi:hypothetical protein
MGFPPLLANGTVGTSVPVELGLFSSNRRQPSPEIAGKAKIDAINRRRNERELDFCNS